MTTRPLAVLLALAALFLGSASARAQERELLYSKALSDKLREAVELLRNRRVAKVPFADLTIKTDCFVRIVPRGAILKDKDIKDNALLGIKPFVFLTTPESLQGRSLPEIFADIGYEPGDILRDKGKDDTVAIVFRYPAKVGVADVKDGRLPPHWDKKVYVPTWANAFALFSRLAEVAPVEPDKSGEFAPERLFFRSAREKAFVLSYPEAGQRRIARTSYARLKATGGADWVYRSLLENKLSLFPHFRGNGRTHNVVLDPDGRHPTAGLLELVGPNSKVNDLPEVAVINLGRLVIAEK